MFVAGATGYIGRFVTKELIKRGYNVVAFSREKSGVAGKKSADDVRADFVGADCRFGDVTDMDSLRAVGFKDKVDVVVSCLASRTGGVEDSNLIDYQASKNCLDALIEQGGSHYVCAPHVPRTDPAVPFSLDIQQSRACTPRLPPLPPSPTCPPRVNDTALGMRRFSSRRFASRSRCSSSSAPSFASSLLSRSRTRSVARTPCSFAAACISDPHSREIVVTLSR